MTTTANPEQTPGQEALFEVPELPELDTPQRLKVLGQDPRAGFLPATNLEKNWALSLLDYIDILDPVAQLRTPRSGHPARTAGQLNEVFRHHKTLQRIKHPEDKFAAEREGVREGQRAMRSIAFSFGDFLANAIAQRVELQQFEHDMDECPKPAVTLQEELGMDHKGIAPFVRFFDLYEFRRLGFSPLQGYDPLRTKVVREGVEEADRNKYVEDQYTAADLDPVMAARLSHVASTLTIGAVRTSIVKGNVNLARGAVIDQQRRISFWTARLRESRSHMAAKPIAERVLASLDIAVR